MNTVTVTGQLTADSIPEPGPDALLCHLRLAVQRPHCPERVDGFDVTCHGRLAAVAAEQLETGRLVAVTGWLRAHIWPTDDWTGRWIDIVAISIDFLARPPAALPVRPEVRCPPGSRLRRPLRHRRGLLMILIVQVTVLAATAGVVDWVERDPETRRRWLADCVRRDAEGDWGDLDADDCRLNELAAARHDGRVLSRYQLPADLAVSVIDDAVWIITDDLATNDSPTTILWPSEYVRHEAL